MFLLKLLDWNDTYTNAKMRLTLGTYMTNPSCMAISLLMAEGGDYQDEPYGNLTVNLSDNDELLPMYYAYVDVNNMPEVENILQASGLAKPVGTKRQSGFVLYPLYVFDKNVLSEYVPEKELEIYEDSYARFEASHSGTKSKRRQPNLPDDFDTDKDYEDIVSGFGGLGS